MDEAAFKEHYSGTEEENAHNHTKIIDCTWFHVVCFGLIQKIEFFVCLFACMFFFLEFLFLSFLFSFFPFFFFFFKKEEEDDRKKFRQAVGKNAVVKSGFSPKNSLCGPLDLFTDAAQTPCLIITIGFLRTQPAGQGKYQASLGSTFTDLPGSSRKHLERAPTLKGKFMAVFPWGHLRNELCLW